MPAQGKYADARVTSYERNGLTFQVTDAGPLDGPVVVLLHGFPQRATSWRAVAERLNEAGFRTIAPDQRGYSPEARPRRRRDYLLAELVADVAALIDVLGDEPVHLVGHDWGANVAWCVASSRPELVRTLTALSVPHPAALKRAMRSRDQARRSWYIAAIQLPVLPELALNSGRADRLWRSSGMTEEMVQRYRSEIVETGALHFALQWYRALPLKNPRGLGGRTRVPTTLVWSDRDVALGRLGAELTASYVVADYHLEVIEGASHWLPEEQPDRVAAAILARIHG